MHVCAGADLNSYTYGDSRIAFAGHRLLLGPGVRFCRAGPTGFGGAGRAGSLQGRLGVRGCGRPPRAGLCARLSEEHDPRKRQRD